MPITNPTTIQLLTEARELMHQLITNDGSWQLRYYQERRINWLREQFNRENAEASARMDRDLELLTSIFS